MKRGRFHWAWLALVLFVTTLDLVLAAPVTLHNPQGSDLWLQAHEDYWGCFRDLLAQGREYKSCGDRANLIVPLLKPPQPARVLNQTIVNYPFSNHPCEDKPGNVAWCKAHATACSITRFQFDDALNNCHVDLEGLTQLLKGRLK